MKRIRQYIRPSDNMWGIDLILMGVCLTWLGMLVAATAIGLHNDSISLGSGFFYDGDGWLITLIGVFVTVLAVTAYVVIPTFVLLATARRMAYRMNHHGK